MKKIISYILLLAIVATFAVLFSACGGDYVTLNVYNWGEYISDGSDGSVDVNAEFVKYCESQGLKVKVNYNTYDSNESMYSKLKSGAVSYDVVVPSDYMVERLITEDMLETLNLNNIPNYQYIDDNYKNLYYDNFTDKTYSVPYFYGTVGIIYNTKFVDESDVGSWDLMWNEKYSGKILQFNNPRDAFGTAMYKLGIDVTTTSSSNWQAALDALKEQKPLVKAYVMDEIFNAMKNESAWVAAYYAGDFLSMYCENDSLAFYFPEEGTNTFIDAFCIPKGSANKELAEMYINFMLSKEAGIANSEYVMYSSPNSLVFNDPDYIKTMADIHENALEYLAADPSLMTVEPTYFKNLDPVTLTTLNTLWEELKIDNSSNKMIFIICGSLVAVAVGVVVFRTVKKKKYKY